MEQLIRCENGRLFTLTNGRIAYVVYLNDAGYLETLYFGGTPGEPAACDLAFLSGQTA